MKLLRQKYLSLQKSSFFNVDQLNLLDVYKTKVYGTLTYQYTNDRTLYNRRPARD